MSFVVASFVTNVAFASLRQVVNELLQHDDDICLSELSKICHSFRCSFGTELRNQKIIGADASLLNRLQHIQQTLFRSKNDGVLASRNPPCSRCAQASAKEVQSKVVTGTADSQELSSAIIDNIFNWRTSEFMTNNIVMRSTPVYPDVVDELIKDTKSKTESWLAILGMNLMTQCYKVYLQTLKKPSWASQSRVSALKLAQQARSQITALLGDDLCFPCRCTQTLAYHLQKVLLDMHHYMSHNCWDLIYQAPWVAGNHVLEILDVCNYYGHHLLKYRHYVGAVFHSYNVLKQLGGLDEIPILEQICTQLCRISFPGGKPPKANFHASWARYVGARLKFKKGYRGKHSHDNWCLTIPAHAAQAAAGLGLADHRTTEIASCLLFQIKQQEYHITDAQWKSLHTSHVRTHPVRHNYEVQQSSDTTSLTTAAQNEEWNPLLLATATEAVGKEEPGRLLPMARLNLFVVFAKCVRVISRLSDKMHNEQKLGKGEYCVCFCNELLAAADRLVKDRRLGKLAAWKKHERELIDDAKKAIVEVFGALKEDELLWDI